MWRVRRAEKGRETGGREPELTGLGAVVALSTLRAAGVEHKKMLEIKRG